MIFSVSQDPTRYEGAHRRPACPAEASLVLVLLVPEPDTSDTGPAWDGGVPCLKFHTLFNHSGLPPCVTFRSAPAGMKPFFLSFVLLWSQLPEQSHCVTS